MNDPPPPPPDPPSSSGFPDETNTGPSAPGLVPAVSSGARLQSTANGQTLQNFHAENVIVRHNNVTVRNFIITREDVFAWFALTTLAHQSTGLPVTGLTIEDGTIITRINGVPSPATGHAINGSNMTVRRMDISYMDNGIVGHSFTAEDNYIHNMERYENEHVDGMVAIGVGNCVIRHNTILLPNQPNGTVAMFSQSAPINNMLIENNYLNGGSYTIYHRDQGYGVPTNVTIKDNHIGRDYMFGLLRSDGPQYITQSGNVWADTLQPVTL